MKLRLTVPLIFLAITTWAQQPSRRVPTPMSNLPGKSSAVSKSASEIHEENRDSIAVIVAAGNTSLKLGTGFFVRSTGLLLTNFHVVEGTDVVGVKIPGSDEVHLARKATGFDVDNDLVVLEVETAEARPVILGDSDQVRVGEPIVVVGNPEGLEETVSNGLLSGMRQLEGRNLLQISAPISEGSSGSPVFDSRGEVIGVVVSSLQSGQNLNFAVPINYAKHLISSSTEEEISALPRRTNGETQAGNKNPPSPPPADSAKLAVEAMRKIAGEIRACQGFSEIVTTEEKKPHYAHFHADRPTDVRFDVKPRDSLVAPFEGVVEFSVHFAGSRDMPTAAEAASAPDYPKASKTVRARYLYWISGSTVHLDYQTYFDDQQEAWLLRQGKPDACWDRVGKP
jgi:S1-C subfamily serine protease